MPALPGTSLTGPHPGSAGVPPASGPKARHIAKRATPTLSGFSSARPRQGTQGRPRRHWAPRAGCGRLGGVARGSSRLAFGPLRAPALRRSFAGAGARPCGPEARAPRTSAGHSQGHAPGSAGPARAGGPHIAKRATPTLSGFSSATSLLSALGAFGPCGQVPALPGHGSAPWGAGVSPASGHRPAHRPGAGERTSPVVLGSAPKPTSTARAPPAEVLGSAPKAGGGVAGSGRLGGVAGSGVSLLSALCGPSARAGKMPALPGHHSQSHPLGARASRPQAGHRPATSPSGRRPRSRASPAPVLGRAPKTDLDGIGRLRAEVWPARACGRLGGVAGSGVSLLSALCGPSARCGQDARAPRTSLTGPPPGSAGVPPASGPQARHMGKRATPTLSGFSSARPRQGTQGRPRRHWAPRAGVWRGCGRLGGVAGSGVSLLSALCGPSARCGQDARAPRDITHRATTLGAPRASRPQAGRRPAHRQAGDAHALGRLQRGSVLGRADPRPPRGAGDRRPAAWARGRRPRSRGFSRARPRSAGSGPEVWPARGSSRLGRVAPVGTLRAFGPVRADARAPRTSLTGPHPGSAGVPPASGPKARHMAKRATPTLSGCSSASPRQCTQGRPRRHWAPRGCGRRGCGRLGGVAGSGVSLLSALCGPSARCGQEARAPRTSLTEPPPGSAGVPPASGPKARRMGKRATPTLSGFSSARPRQGTQGRPRRHWAPPAEVWPARGSSRLGRVAPVGALRAFGPVRARGPRSQDITHRATPWERGRPARKRAAGPPHGQAGDAHALGLLQRPSSAGHPRPTSTALGASGGGWPVGRVAGSGGRLCGPARASVAPVGTLRAFGPQAAGPARRPRSQDIAPGRASGRRHWAPPAEVWPAGE